MSDEYTCRECGHQFPGPPPCGAAIGVTCPRCGGRGLNHNPWLLGTSGTEGLTDEDYYDVYLSP